MSPKYDVSFYIRVLDQYVATGECSDTDDEPLYAYLLSIMMKCVPVSFMT